MYNNSPFDLKKLGCHALFYNKKTASAEEKNNLCEMNPSLTDFNPCLHPPIFVKEPGAVS